ncbi:hypothetical protein CKA32_006064 [Geitlerinema sp. FC II]|nr:hypothetical protein CKA32_006064 [Geitlerinema sp. FC II]
MDPIYPTNSVCTSFMPQFSLDLKSDRPQTPILGDRVFPRG